MFLARAATNLLSMPSGSRPAAPGPRARFPGQLLLRLQRDPLAFLDRVRREHGDVALFRIGPQPIALLSAPDDIRDVLVTSQRNFTKGRGLERARLLLGEGLLTSEGEFHLRQRRLVQPAFHRQRVLGYGDTMVEVAARTRDRWRDGETRDVHEAMMALTLAVVARTLFGANVDRETERIGAALDVAMKAFRIANLPFSELIEKLPIPTVRRFRRARAELDAIVYGIVAERRRSGEDRGDLLSMLLLAQDELGDGGGMTDEQLRDECMTLFLAGHETTANLLAWTFHLLGAHPEAERRVHEEVDALGDRLPSPADFGALPWIRAVLAESLRLFPPAWILGRRAKEPFDVRGYEIPARTIVLMSQWLVHRDERWWPDAGRFLPERWLDADENARRPKFAYFPFGAGTRVCVGEQFAWMEGALVLAAIAQRWKLRPAPGVRVAPEPLITLRPRDGLRMRIEARR